MKVLAIGLVAAGLSAGLGATALAAAGSPAVVAHPASVAVAAASSQAQPGPAGTGSPAGVTIAQLTAEIRQLEQLQASGRATAVQIVKLHQLEAELAQLTAAR